ncbi:50S ribosomal protein L11 methyltransferase [Kordia sp. YSTF-M3]|uniref:50S ribosomal protein L11 methyltransferase n=1 Tax=Kordia aestuariivivens TaxID=2759037 RepID=A0ABR7Q3X1_9FLAO|nr:50S ribosomal protein L11 methyltransferase [Kordia aestuariivivens]MBC8753242.1 50S ribosomal protein L11 methyltransferase [Kordia aestuariivivens]
MSSPTIFTSLGEPYELTPDEVVLEKLRLLDLKDGELLFDLGCGDARSLIAASKMAKVTCVGYEILPVALKAAAENLKKEGNLDSIEIRAEDFFNADISKVDALILYLTRNMLGKISLKLENELPVGARIVTHDFDIPAWEAEKVVNFISRKATPFTLYLYRKK